MRLIDRHEHILFEDGDCRLGVSVPQARVVDSDDPAGGGYVFLVIGDWRYCSERRFGSERRLGAAVKRYGKLLSHLRRLREGGWQLRGNRVVCPLTHHPYAWVEDLKEVRQLPYVIADYGSSPEQALTDCDHPGFAAVNESQANVGVLAVEGDCLLVARDEPGGRQLRAILLRQVDGSLVRLHSQIASHDQQQARDALWRSLLRADGNLTRHGYRFMDNSDGAPWPLVIMPNGKVWLGHFVWFSPLEALPKITLGQHDYLEVVEQVVASLLRRTPTSGRPTSRAGDEQDEMWHLAIDLLPERTSGAEVEAVARAALLRPEGNSKHRIALAMQERDHKIPPMLRPYRGVNDVVLKDTPDWMVIRDLAARPAG